MAKQLLIFSLAFVVGVVSVAPANADLIFNPGFDDLDLDGDLGDGWGAFGNAGFNDFFGNPHASFFSDSPGNLGGVFQTGISSSASAVSYTFTLDSVRLEENIDANVRFGLEYYAADDTTQIGVDTVPIDLSTTGDGLSFSMTSIPAAGATFVRPIIQFDNVQSTVNAQENFFVFNATLTATSIPEPSAISVLLIVLACGMQRRQRSIGC